MNRYLFTFRVYRVNDSFVRNVVIACHNEEEAKRQCTSFILERYPKALSVSLIGYAVEFDLLTPSFVE